MSMPRRKAKLVGLVGCCSLLVFVAGCEHEIDPTEALAQANDTNIARLSNLYFTFQMKHGWKGPKNEEQFKSFLKRYNPKKLTRIGVDPSGIDQLFISQRDGEPFKIRYSVPGSAYGSSEPVVFESQGVEGKRMVGFLNMTHREVEGAEYDQLWASRS